MDTVQVSTNELTALLTDSANFVSEAGTRLEKLASHESKLKTYSHEWAEKLAEAGLIQAKDVDAFANEVNTGGIDKIAEMVDFIVRNTGTPALGKGSDRQRTKTASADKNETADQVWNRLFNLRA